MIFKLGVLISATMMMAKNSILIHSTPPPLPLHVSWYLSLRISNKPMVPSKSQKYWCLT